MILVSLCRCLCPINSSQVLSRSLRCSWSSADRRCSNYIWVIDNFIAYQDASYIGDLTVLLYYLLCMKAKYCQLVWTEYPNDRNCVLFNAKYLPHDKWITNKHINIFPVLHTRAAVLPSTCKMVISNLQVIPVVQYDAWVILSHQD